MHVCVYCDAPRASRDVQQRSIQQHNPKAKMYMCTVQNVREVVEKSGARPALRACDKPAPTLAIRRGNLDEAPVA